MEKWVGDMIYSKKGGKNDMRNCGMCHDWVKKPEHPGYCDAPLPAWVRQEYEKAEWSYRMMEESDGKECETYRDWTT